MFFDDVAPVEVSVSFPSVAAISHHLHGFCSFKVRFFFMEAGVFNPFLVKPISNPSFCFVVGDVFGFLCVFFDYAHFEALGRGGRIPVRARAP